MKPKLIALIISDLHINLWSKFNEDNQRTMNHFKVLEKMAKLSEKYQVPTIFGGDLFHKPENMGQEFAHIVQREFYNLQRYRWEMWAISGNHDLNQVNTLKNMKSSWMTYFSRYHSWLKSLDDISQKLNDNIVIHGLPYIDHNEGMMEYLKGWDLLSRYKHILLIHSDYPGAKDTDGRIIDSSENINVEFLEKKFDLILCGHIHKPQQISNKVFMIGAPLQQRRTDKDCKLGYWKLYSDLTLEFKPIDEMPRFIDVTSEDDILDDGNYYTLISKVQTENINTNTITRDLSKEKIISKYLKEKGVKDKAKKNLLLNLLKEAEND